MNKYPLKLYYIVNTKGIRKMNTLERFENTWNTDGRTNVYIPDIPADSLFGSGIYDLVITSAKINAEENVFNCTGVIYEEKVKQLQTAILERLDFNKCYDHILTHYYLPTLFTCIQSSCYTQFEYVKRAYNTNGNMFVVSIYISDYERIMEIAKEKGFGTHSWDRNVFEFFMTDEVKEKCIDVLRKCIREFVPTPDLQKYYEEKPRA